ncbi:hypothetical protein ABPG75_013600 [Micractinium tetrahymenae]
MWPLPLALPQAFNCTGSGQRASVLQMQALVQQIDTLVQRIDRVVDRVDTVVGRVDTLQLAKQQQGQRLDLVLDMSLDAHNTAARLQSSLANAAADRLKPLRNEQPGSPAYGQLPPQGAFPATLAERVRISNARLKQLAAFYGLHFAGVTVEQRRQAFEVFITHGV